MKRRPATWLMAVWIVAWAVFSLPWTSATSTAHWDRIRPPYVRAYSRIRLDHVLNVLFYLPAAPLAAALGWPLSAGVAAGAAMSAVAEGSQVFSSDRAPNGNDVIANVAGAAAGAVGMLLYRRRRRR
jgi:VanZ family protein